MSLFRLVPTGLDLNGPDLAFTTNPVGVATSTAGIATFTGIATANFTTVGDVSNSPNNLGIITYRWYRVGVGSLTDGNTSAGNTISGAGSTVLTISNLTNDETEENIISKLIMFLKLLLESLLLVWVEFLQEMHQMNR